MEMINTAIVESGKTVRLDSECDYIIDKGYGWLGISQRHNVMDGIEIVGFCDGLLPSTILGHIVGEESELLLIGGSKGCKIVKTEEVARDIKLRALEDYKYSLIRILQTAECSERLKINRIPDIKALRKLGLCNFVDMMDDDYIEKAGMSKYDYKELNHMYALQYPKFLAAIVNVPNKDDYNVFVDERTEESKNSKVVLGILNELGIIFEPSEIEDAFDEAELNICCNDPNMKKFANILNRSGNLSIKTVTKAPKIGSINKVCYLTLQNERIRELTNDIELQNALSSKLTVYGIYALESKIISLGGLFKFFSTFKRSFSLILIASFLTQLFTIVLPLSFQQVIDKVIAQQNVDLIPVFLFAMVSAAVLAGTFRFFRSLLLFSVATTADNLISKSTLTSLINAEYEYYATTKRGDLVGRVNESASIKNFFTGPAVNTLLDTLFSFTYLAILLLYSVKLTILSLLPVPIYLIGSFIGSPYYKKLIKRKANSGSVLISYMLEVVSGIQSVKLQGFMAKALEGWENGFNNVQKTAYKLTVFGSLLGETSQFLIQASSLITIFVGATLVINGELTLGELISFRIISGFLTNPLLRLTSVWQALQDVTLSIERINLIRGWPQERIIGGISNLTGDPRSITICDLEFNYNNKTIPVLIGLSAEIEPGSINAIIGKSGSGKSTIFKILTGLYAKYSGTIFVGGTELSKISVQSLRKNIYCVPQDAHFFSGTIEENVCYGKENVKSKEIYKALELASATELINSKYGLRTRIEEGAQNLSGGQKQRLALARLLLHRPNIILLDECTSALDPITEKQVLSNVFAELKNSTIILITHRIATTRLCDIIYILKDGSIENYGTFQHLKEKSNYFQEMLEKGDNI